MRPSPSQVRAPCWQPRSDAARGGFSFAKIRALRDLAEKTLSGIVPPSAHLHELTDEAIVERLTQVRGIGPWTVHMMLMFQLVALMCCRSMISASAMAFASHTASRALPTPRA